MELCSPRLDGRGVGWEWSWFVTDSSEMLSHLPRPGRGSAGKEGWDHLLQLLAAVRCPYC